MMELVPKHQFAVVTSTWEKSQLEIVMIYTKGSDLMLGSDTMKIQTG